MAIDESDLVRLGHANQVAYFRHLAVHAAGGVVEEDDRYLCFAGGHPQPGTFTNGVIRKSPAIGAAELLARADVFFGRLGRQYVLWSRADVDRDLDLEAGRRRLWARPPAEGNACIVLGHPLPAVPVPSGYRIAPAESDTDLAEYLGLVARNWELAGADRELAEALLFSVASLRGPEVAVLAAYDEAGRMCAGISGFLAESCLGVEWGATDPSARGRGLARCLMQQMCEWGFRRGAEGVWGVASAQGTPVWVRMGFTVATRFRRYLVTDHLRGAGPVATDRSAAPRRRGATRPDRR
jgi:GNAT superfamily N-acetyltransferase